MSGMARMMDQLAFARHLFAFRGLVGLDHWIILLWSNMSMAVNLSMELIPRYHHIVSLM